jgi:hypothetical protein
MIPFERENNNSLENFIQKAAWDYHNQVAREEYIGYSGKDRERLIKRQL